MWLCGHFITEISFMQMEFVVKVVVAYLTPASCDMHSQFILLCSVDVVCIAALLYFAKFVFLCRVLLINGTLTYI